MAYIDPEGMFGGDRMALLSDAARMAWPWFWCASNTVGRVELNYRDFLNTVFRQFKVPPTEAQFWDWVAEYHESYLMFVYESNGQVWGQWWASEKYLPTYKTVSDKRTPAPLAGLFIEWQRVYENNKLSSISGKCRILNVSGKIPGSPKLSVDSEKFSLGEERRGEIEERIGKSQNQPPAPDGAGLFPDDPPPTETPADHGSVVRSAPPTGKQRPKKVWYDEQHEIWYQAFWNHKAKDASRRAYEKAINRIVDSEGKAYNAARLFLAEVIVADRRKFEPTEEWDTRVKIHPATYLNGHRWTDEVGPSKNGHAAKGGMIFDGPEGTDGYEVLR